VNGIFKWALAPFLENHKMAFFTYPAFLGHGESCGILHFGSTTICPA